MQAGFGRRDVLALAAGCAATVALLALAFPPAGVAPLAWVALVPLLFVLGRQRGKLGLLVVWLAGLAFGTIGFSWVRHVTWLGTLLLGFYVSLYFVLFCTALRWLSYRRRIPLALAAPLAWTALEYIRGVFLSGIPWVFLAHTQYKDLPLIQIADLAGEPGVTFWLVAVNGVLADAALCLLRQKGALRPARVLVAALAVLAVSAAAQLYGSFRLNTLITRRGPAIAVIQGNVPQDVKNLMTEETLHAIFLGHLTLTDEALSGREQPRLVIWPETMAPPEILDERYNVPENPWRAELVRRQRSAGLLIGSVANEGNDARPVYFNSVYYLPRGGPGPSGRYDKIHLVPFGEYVPLKRLIGWLVGPMIPYKTGLTPGTTPRLFEIDGWRFAPTVCFEDAFGDLVANFARGGRKMDFIVNVTNEGWFKDGSELDEHLAIAVFRAVECRAGFVRAANTGISAFISPTGRILSTLTVDGKDREVAGVLHGVATTADVRPLYLDVRELFGKLCVVGWFSCMILAALPGIMKRIGRRPGRLGSLLLFRQRR